MVKKFSILIILISIYGQLLSQIINCNPDPNAPPWILGPGNTIGDSLPPVIFSPEATSAIDEVVDNSALIFFGEIFNQISNCCAQASGVTYTFAYEINRYKNENGDEDEHKYPPHYTYNYLDGGNDDGSAPTHGWDIIEDNGCPCVLDWGLGFQQFYVWMDGFGNYENSIWNRINQTGGISVSDWDDLGSLKTWIDNHNDPDAETGGLAVFCEYFDDDCCRTITNGPYQGQEYIGEWDDPGGNEMVHCMTVVGYDDFVDFGNNSYNYGLGGFKIANSWGTGFGTNGFI